MLLEKYNVDLNDQDDNGLTPLMYAIYGYKHNDIEPQDEFDVNFARLLTKYSTRIDFSLSDVSSVQCETLEKNSQKHAFRYSVDHWCICLQVWERQT